MVSAEILQGFPELVSGLGGDVQILFRACRIDPQVMEDVNGSLHYGSLVRLLALAAKELDCPDFGMRLAFARDPIKIITPIDLVMRSSHTLEEALRFCTDNIHVYSDAIHLGLESLVDPSQALFRFEIPQVRMAARHQTVEHALSLMLRGIFAIYGFEALPREIWFTHDPVSAPAVYRTNLKVPVRFGTTMNGLVLKRSALKLQLAKPDRQLHALATDFIALRFPARRMSIATEVSMLIQRSLGTDSCTQERIAAVLGMHPRTLQRRLREESTGFETLKDDVRKYAAFDLLTQGRTPLMRISERLGYAEVSSFSRSCFRWFSASPSTLRRRAR